MAAIVLNSQRAVSMSHHVIRAFVRMREELLDRANLERRLAEIERTKFPQNPLPPIPYPAHRRKPGNKPAKKQRPGTVFVLPDLVQ